MPRPPKRKPFTRKSKTTERKEREQAKAAAARKLDEAAPSLHPNPCVCRSGITYCPVHGIRKAP